MRSRPYEQRDRVPPERARPSARGAALEGAEGGAVVRREGFEDGPEVLGLAEREPRHERAPREHVGERLGVESRREPRHAAEELGHGVQAELQDHAAGRVDHRPQDVEVGLGDRLTPDEVAYDYITEAEGQYLYFPVVNYVVGDHEPIREMMTDQATLLGLSDGGAHCTSIVDSGLPSFMLAHWGRDRHRGPRLPLELLVKRQTSETADFFGLTDRGRLAPGMRADLNLIDFDRLLLHKPELVHDMPANGRRFIQRVEGYEATLVAGTPIFERGEHTGALPGRLVRAGRHGEAVKAA